jgi:hypothetical protein
VNVLNKLFSVFLLTSLGIIAFLGYDCYVLQTENFGLKTDLQNLSESHHMLEGDYQKLSNNFNLLNQSYHVLNADYAYLSQSYNMLNADYAYLNQTHELLVQNYTMLSTEYQTVLTDYVNLISAYGLLNETYRSLLQNYTELEQEASNYVELLSEYQELTQNYQLLMQNYTQLKNEYAAVFAAFYEPLPPENETVPTVAELKQWLAEDKTDEISYTMPDFVCGDYSVMLHMHAKLKNWDMGIICILGNFSDGSEFNHAFNVIMCQEGLRYVEPQNDEVFDAVIDDDVWYNHPGFGQVYVHESLIVVLYR